ncbi:MAG: alpha/beta hydrolase, partial [Planctomycetales bacterium]|nr:alpha/beta hydrolase [Planctomycetales bacterium]
WRRRAAVYQFVRDIPRGPQHPTWRTLEQIDAGLAELRSLPQLLVWGERDWCFTTECLDRFVHVWPEADVVRLPDVGHWVVEDAPEDALHALREFVQST